MFSWCCCLNCFSCYGTRQPAEKDIYSHQAVQLINCDQISCRPEVFDQAETNRSTNEFPGRKRSRYKSNKNRSRTSTQIGNQEMTADDYQTKRNSRQKSRPSSKDHRAHRRRLDRRNKNKGELISSEIEQKVQLRWHKKSKLENQTSERYSGERARNKKERPRRQKIKSDEKIAPEVQQVDNPPNLFKPLPNDPFEMKNYHSISELSPQAQMQIFEPESSFAESLNEPTKKASTQSLSVERSQILSRQIPIIKVIGDIQEVPKINVPEQIPPYRSVEESKDVKKVYGQDLIENLRKEVSEIAKRSLKKESKNLQVSFEKQDIKMRTKEDEITPSDLATKSNSFDQNFKVRIAKSGTSLKSRTSIRTSSESNVSPSEVFQLTGRFEKQATTLDSEFNPHTSLSRMKKKETDVKTDQTANHKTVLTKIIDKFRETVRIDKPKFEDLSLEKNSSKSLGSFI